MRVLSSIVQIATLPMFNFRKQLAFCHTVAPWFVGDEDTWHILQALQQPLEEALRCPGIAAALHQNVEHDAILVNGTPEIMQYSLDTNEHLIEVPLVTRPRAPRRSLSAKLAPNFTHHCRTLS